MLSNGNSLLVLLFSIPILYIPADGEICFKKLHHKKIEGNQICRLLLVNKHDEPLVVKNPMKCCKREGSAGYYDELVPVGRHGRKFVCHSCIELLEKKQKKNSRSMWSEWSEWNNCTCGRKFKSRARVCLNQTCEGESVETESCNITECSDFGFWSSWSGYSECSVTCGTGIQIRTRDCLGSTSGANMSCTGNSTEEKECTSINCPIHGGWSNWVESGLCSTTCGEGELTLTRECNNPEPKYGGDFCNGRNITNEKCYRKRKCPRHGEWSFWTRWGSCQLEDGITCGQGRRIRTRTCDAPKPRFGGEDCRGHEKEEKPCYTISCDDESIDGSGLEYADGT